MDAYSFAVSMLLLALTMAYGVANATRCFVVRLHTTGKEKHYTSMQLRNNSLVVDFATDTDEGYYMCQANNGIGTGLTATIYINVNGMYTTHITQILLLSKNFSKKKIM